MRAFDEEVRRDIWKFWDDGFYIVIPTNGFVKNDGTNVMGRGLARVASTRIQTLPGLLGGLLAREGNHVYAFPELRVFTFPVKDHWRDDASLELIEQSCQELKPKAEMLRKFPVYIPRVGCGNGRLSWEDVRPLLVKHLDARFVCVWEPGHNE